MSMHAPVFLKDENRKTSKKFINDTKADILAVLDLLYSRGMWSKYHYDKWSEEVKNSNDEVYLHSFWDAIVNGCMHEADMKEIMEMRQEGLAGKAIKE